MGIVFLDENIITLICIKLNKRGKTCSDIIIILAKLTPFIKSSNIIYQNFLNPRLIGTTC